MKLFKQPLETGAVSSNPKSIDPNSKPRKIGKESLWKFRHVLSPPLGVVFQSLAIYLDIGIFRLIILLHYVCIEPPCSINIC